MTESSSNKQVKDGGADDEVKAKVMYDNARKCLADISAILRSVNSLKVAIPAFCDILIMYAKTEHYFTQNERYKKSRSDTVAIRNCDVRHPEGANMDQYSQGKKKYEGCKEYDSQYIWGQLVGWFKQTVDKPNASLSADRRGTLSIPDVQSFIAGEGTKYQLEHDRSNATAAGSSAENKKKKRKGEKDSIDEVITQNQGTRSRPKPQKQPSTEQVEEGEPQSAQQKPDGLKGRHAHQREQGDQDEGVAPRSQQQKLKVVYPSKRF